MVRVLAFYDISDDAKRRRAAERLQSLGFTRIQKSVYIAKGGASLAKEAWRALSRIVDPKTDSVYIIVVPTSSVEEAYSIGGEKGARVVGGLVTV